MQHGSGATLDLYISTNANYIAMREALEDAGFIVAAGNNHYNSWGNESSLWDVYNLDVYAHNRLNLLPYAFAQGGSMGGITTLNYITHYPGRILGVTMTYPASNLYWAYTAAHSSSDFSSYINDAYGCNAGTYATATEGHDPALEFETLKDVLIKIWHGDSDVVVGIDHSTYLVNNLTTRNGYGSLITMPGVGHGSPDFFNSSAVIAFYNSLPFTTTPTFTITTSSASVAEADTTITITITKTNTRDINSTVNLATSDGTAIEPNDYTAISQNLTFTPSEYTKSVILSIKDDGHVNSAIKTFTVALSNPTGNATLGTPSSVTIQITPVLKGEPDQAIRAGNMNLLLVVMLGVFVILYSLGSLLIALKTGFDTKIFLLIISGGIILGITLISFVVLTYLNGEMYNAIAAFNL
jgi:hypothetical protein